MAPAGPREAQAGLERGSCQTEGGGPLPPHGAVAPVTLPETHWWSTNWCLTRTPTGRAREAIRPGSHVICPCVSDVDISSRFIDSIFALTRCVTNHSQPCGLAQRLIAILGRRRGLALAFYATSSSPKAARVSELLLFASKTVQTWAQ